MRIKLRTLLGVLASVLLLGWFGYNQLPSLLYYNGYSAAVLEWFPDSRYAKPAANELAYEYVDRIDSNGENRIFISSLGWGLSGSGNAATTEQREAAAVKVEQLVKRYDSGHAMDDIHYRLAKHYFWSSQWEQAEKLLRELAGAVPGWEEELEAYLNILQSRHERQDAKPSVEGVLRIGGSPVPNALVFLVEANAAGYYSNPFPQYPMTITDGEGKYRFYDLKPKEYEAGVGLLPEQIAGYVLAEQPGQTFTAKKGVTASHDIDFHRQVQIVAPSRNEVVEGDEIAFHWEPYEGAAYYKLYMTTPFRGEDGEYSGGATAELSDQHYTSTTVSYSLGELAGISAGSSGKSFAKDGSAILLSSGLLGRLHPGGEFIWSVEAYDAEGRKLSSSAGHYLDQETAAPLFRISEQGMLEGDRLILQNKYEEAIAAYEEEGSDYALRVLARLAEQGITQENGDAAEALAYLRRLSAPLPQDLREIARLEEAVKKK
ncbi:hypothetical protein [Paenibacillus sp. PL2-23]|uniref:hypothetical protein n=1 Tax=Paenibacillus sp. PL2-23 TaxID=2100729 RepID=UPI0030FC24D4